MNVADLIPRPLYGDAFRRSRERFIPEKPGCYILATIAGIILYIGLAANLRRRMNNHLDDPRKTLQTKFGRATRFFWLESSDTNKIERTWMNMHIQMEGELPVLNSIYSPTAT